MEYLWQMGSTSKRIFQRTFAVSSGSLKRGGSGMFTSMGVSSRRQAAAGINHANLMVIPTGFSDFFPMGHG